MFLYRWFLRLFGFYCRIDTVCMDMGDDTYLKVTMVVTCVSSHRDIIDDAADSLLRGYLNDGWSILGR